jgi:hypothetical protein
MLTIHSTLNHPKYAISRLFLSAVPFSKLRFQTDQMKSAGYLNGTFYNGLHLFGPVVTHPRAVALPKAKQHGMNASKARREEMLKHTEASAAAKDNLTA